MIALKHSRWQDAMELPKGRGVNALISDPPYSKKTHEGQNDTRSDGSALTVLDYNHWEPSDVDAFVDAWSPVVDGWMACMTDSELAPAFRAAYDRNGRQSFQPIPCVIRGMTVRMSGDGPSSWAVWLMVARPKGREWAGWGTLPGAYTGPRSECPIIGGKPEWLMSAIIRDYTRPGDTIVDPCAGGATTLLCADALGRNAFGMEMDAATYAIAQARLDERARMGVQHDLFSGATNG